MNFKWKVGQQLKAEKMKRNIYYNYSLWLYIITKDGIKLLLQVTPGISSFYSIQL